MPNDSFRRLTSELSMEPDNSKQNAGETLLRFRVALRSFPDHYVVVGAEMDERNPLNEVTLSHKIINKTVAHEVYHAIIQRLTHTKLYDISFDYSIAGERATVLKFHSMAAIFVKGV